jgi:hypothetical protein
MGMLVQEASGVDRFDFIKIDIEGVEKELLEDTDPETRKILCEARCIFAELHDRYIQGCEAAFQSFAKDACPEGHGFTQLHVRGEYTLYCREDLPLD